MVAATEFIPSGPLSREAPQVSQQPLRINSFGTRRSTNLMSKHLLNNLHDVFLSEMLVGNPTFCLSTLPSRALRATRISELQRSTEHSPKRGRTSTDSGKEKNLAHNMLVSVIIENHRLMFGFSPRGSKTETVMGRRSTLEFGPRKRGRKKNTE